MPSSYSVPISKKTAPLPISMAFDPDEYIALLRERMQLFLSGENVFLGNAIDVSAPAYNKGLWITPDRAPWAWNESAGRYLPAEIGFVSTDKRYATSVFADPTIARTLTLPDASGTAALVTDISVPKETVILTSSSGTASTIDANVSNNFFLTLTENTTIPSLTNMALGSGKKVRIAILNDGTSYTVTWPSVGANAIKWPASPSHTQPAATPSQPQALAIYTITEANVGLTAHLWGDPEVSGFQPVGDEIETGGEDEIPLDYHPRAQDTAIIKNGRFFIP